MVERQVRHMVRLIDDLMEVTRISRGKVDLQRSPVALADVLGMAVETSQPAFIQNAGPQDPHAVTLAGRRILVVDDNRDAADSLCELLAARGAETRAVYGGQAAIAAFEASRPDAIVLDIGMPDMDGYEVARRIRGEEGAGAIRIVALTGWGQHADRQRSRAAGFDHHLTKPAELHSLVSFLV